MGELSHRPTNGIERIVVVGAGYAGVLAALRASRLVGERARVTLVGASPWFVERIRLHQRAAGGHAARRPITELLDGTRVEFVHTTVRSLDLGGRRVLTDGAPLAFDRLIYALGSHVDRDAVPGVREHAATLDPGTADALAARLASLPEAAPVVVCGAGHTGIEAATELAEAYPSLRLTLVTAGALGEDLAPRAIRHLRRTFARLGVTVVEGARVDEVRADAVIAGGRTLPSRVTLWAGGFAVSPIARAAGLAVDDRGRVLVDDRLQSLSHPSVLAVGDAAAPPSVGSPLAMCCKTAMPMGAHAADVIAALVDGRVAAPFRFRDTATCLSLGRGDGLVQFRRSDGTPARLVVTGRLAAWFKERICRFTTWSLEMERRGRWAYRWAKADPQPALADGAQRRLAA